ncbi:DNA sulfur modification protein DndB [Amphritea pacifica]|uniref:DNA sulfur modification protein DndB n=1 Tax=Amphritea pacifica TaxID=2811233 RepID=UPI00196494C6|nr:DNA sulfur modification protein DndB [Amphritea pacifica]MBN1006734.1 DNA sulfur modification protein DndB [Amphritea pacifica]
MDASFEYIFPAIRGIQAGREYYVSMCPLRLISKIFIFDDEELVPELRAQRTLNEARVPEMANYLTENAEDYVFSSLTASIDGRVQFVPLGDGGDASRVGRLKIDMSSQFIINDGQHRRAAINEALKKRPELGDETISVVFFIDRGLERCQQMFADLNRYAIRTSPSIGILYDHRDDKAQITKQVVNQSNAFKDIVEMEKTSLSPRSRKLFTLSAIHSANLAILAGLQNDLDEAIDICVRYWNEVNNCIQEWNQVQEGQITSGEVRQSYVHSQAIVLQALGHLGNKIVQLPEKEQSATIKKLKGFNWKRSNSHTWEGRCMLGGRMQKSSSNVLLTTNLFKTELGLMLTPDEQRAEDAFKRGENGK